MARTRFCSTLMAVVAPAVVGAPACAQADQSYNFDLPSQELGESLRAVAAQSGWQLYAPADAVKSKRVPALRGTLSVRDAVNLLLVGTGLTARFADRTVIVRSGDSADSQVSDDRAIVVTGSRIPGAVVASVVTRIDREAIKAAGQTDLGEAVRALPQNFSGGQNPGVGTGAGQINTNVNSASNVNLRGLGPDATLTLLNGHRLPYDSAFGGVDISAIPVAALDRIEVVADGASAIYGSDAVAGVVNVILRRDYDGVATSGQFGASTDGGNVRGQFDLVAGTRWAGGGLIAAYDYARNSAIAAKDRDSTSALDGANSLYPKQRRHALTLAGHHELAPGVTLSFDALYANRHSVTTGGTVAARYVFAPDVETYSFSPELGVALGSDWTMRVLGTWGRDRTHYDTRFSPAGGTETRTTGCYCNSAWSAEVNAEGPLFALGGGDARMATGAGYRNNGMAFSRVIGGVSSDAFDVSQASTYGFAEVNLPFVTAVNAAPGIRRLSVSAAARYESYPGIAKLATPRIGIVYAPLEDITLKASWARSFKAPTLFQQYVGYQAYLLPGPSVGATGTVLYTSGGNPGLKPERARSWQAGVTFEPSAIPGLRVEASYFDVRYTDRVVQPIAGSIAAAFNNPGFATLIGFDPSAATLAGIIAGAQFGLQNFSGQAYSPDAVSALVDNRYTNVAAQEIRGVDVRASWQTALSADRNLAIEIAGSWLDSKQQLTAALPQTLLSGQVFNPPRARARSGVTYQSPRFAGSVFTNYTGALRDARFAQTARLPGQVTFDMALRYDLIARATPDAEPPLALSLTVNNLWNARPDRIAVTGPTDTPFDSTNYSAIGRFIAIGVARRW